MLRTHPECAKNFGLYIPLPDAPSRHANRTLHSGCAGATEAQARPAHAGCLNLRDSREPPVGGHGKIRRRSVFCPSAADGRGGTREELSPRPNTTLTHYTGRVFCFFVLSFIGFSFCFCLLPKRRFWPCVCFAFCIGRLPVFFDYVGRKKTERSL